MAVNFNNDSNFRA